MTDSPLHPTPSPADQQHFGKPPENARLLPAFQNLCEVIAKLRSPEGCPWDRLQTLATIKPYTLEETYELLEAIDSGDNAAIAEELGDLLLQVVLDAQIAADERRFDLIDVIEGITRKMIDRHPHVFGDAEAKTAADVSQHWEKAKANEKQRESVLEGIPADLPQLARAAKLSKKAAKVGYDFPHRAMLFDKLREEVEELGEELYPGGKIPEIAATVEAEITPDEPIEDDARRARIEGEIGDVLFVIANIARRWQINPEEALRRSNSKFVRRFTYIEQQLAARGRTVKDATLLEMEELYQASKMGEAG
jgi:tetrapyrrole methylase family protein / MazG family protein